LIGLLIVAGFNLLHLLPETIVKTIIFIDDLMLAMAMTALGLLGSGGYAFLMSLMMSLKIF
jgi:uncharacterized membrane protein YadS